MAPEVIRGESTTDGRADIYSLGCVAYWLLTGTPVFPGTTPVDTIRAHIDDTPTPPSELSELPVSSALEALVLACLEKAPAARPQSCEELAHRLDACDLGGLWGPQQAQRWWDSHRRSD